MMMTEVCAVCGMTEKVKEFHSSCVALVIFVDFNKNNYWLAVIIGRQIVSSVTSHCWLQRFIMATKLCQD